MTLVRSFGNGALVLLQTTPITVPKQDAAGPQTRGTRHDTAR